MPEGAATTSAGTAVPSATEPRERRAEQPDRSMLPAHNALLLQGERERGIEFALREAGITVVVEDDTLRAEKLLRRTKFDAVIIDLATMSRTLMSFTRVLRRSDSKDAFLIFLADNAGPIEQDTAHRFGADAVWPKGRLKADVVGSFGSVNAERVARHATAPPGA